jgi:hypothetical protein
MIAAFHTLASVELVVGVPERNNKRKQGDVSNALLAAIAETGSPANNIPARPVIGPGMMKARDAITSHYKGAALALLAGKPDMVEPQLAKAGDAAVAAVRRQLLLGDHAPLKPATIARRRAKGVTSSTPLYDSGQLYDAYAWELRKKGKR